MQRERAHAPLAGAIYISSASLARADEHPRRSGERGHVSEGLLSKEIAAIEGMLEKKELEAWRLLVRRVDVDGDGQLNKGEVDALLTSTFFMQVPIYMSTCVICFLINRATNTVFRQIDVMHTISHHQ